MKRNLILGIVALVLVDVLVERHFYAHIFRFFR